MKNKIKEEKGDTQTVESTQAKQTEAYEKQIEEMKNDLQRTRADFENYRKQVEMQKAQGKKAAEYATVSKFLPLLDDLERAFGTYDELKPLAGSIEKTLKELGLTRIPSQAHVEFDPDLHDAVMVDGEGDKEEISETLRTGYYYDGEVLRPAMVKVQKI